MKPSLFYTIMLTMLAGLTWSIREYRNGLIPVSDIEMMRTIPAQEKDGRYYPEFKIDKYEVTNGQYWRLDNTHTFPPEQVDYPVTGVTWFEAMRYAEWAGKHLPTVEEWMRAAKATKKNGLVPWGVIETIPIEADPPVNQVFRVGKYWRDQTPLGVMDMAGNAWEWTADTLRLDNGELAAIVKGGFILQDGKLVFAGIEKADTVAITTRSPVIGFRCIRRK